MKNKSIYPIIICFVLLFSVIIAAAAAVKGNTGKSNILKTENNSSTEDNAEPVINLDAKDEETELRGVWITYMDLCLQDGKRSEQDFREKFTDIADTCKSSGFNTLIVQVRPFSDSLYFSEIFPFSHIISGRQGEKTDYDPLKIMCEIAKSKDMSVHAWVNPYRIKLKETPESLSDSNPYVINKELGVECDNGIYYNPALQKVRDLIVSGVCEIVKNYDVDGVQFDDYFYPTEDESFDKEQYEQYKATAKEPMSLSEWRKANVNILIAQCYLELHKIKNDIQFGISPQGNIQNNYALGADVISWCKNSGYIDYICPQLYYSTENPALTFEDALNQWMDLEYSGFCNLYIGLAGYKAGSDESDSGTWKGHDDILADEIEILRKHSIVKGLMLYSYDSLVNEQSKDEIENVVKILN